MEFLRGLRQALDIGLSKDEFIKIWTEEMDSKLRAATKDASQAVNKSEQKDVQDTASSAQDTGILRDHVREDEEERTNLTIAVTEMTSQLQQMALRQDELKQNLQNWQQKQTKQQVALTQKLTQIEKAISVLGNTFSESVQTCFEKEGVALKEQLSLTVETHHNHTREQLQKLKVAIVSEMTEKVVKGVEKIFEEKAKQIVAESLATAVLNEQSVEEDDSSDEYCSAENEDDSDDGDENRFDTKANKYVNEVGSDFIENITNDTNSSGESDNKVAQNVTVTPLKAGVSGMVERAKVGRRNTSETEKTSEESSLLAKTSRAPTPSLRSFKAVLHKELNTFMVIIQKLLLKPLTSEDLVHQFTDSIEGLLSSERNFLSDLFREVQTAIVSEMQARFYKLEQSIKKEMLTAVQNFPRSETPEDCPFYGPAAQLYSSHTSHISVDKDTCTYSTTKPSIPLPKRIPIAQQQLWVFKSVSSLLKEKAKESQKIADPHSGYRFELSAKFQTNCLYFSVASLSGKNDAILTWPVNVEISLTVQNRKDKNDSVSVTSRVKEFKNPPEAKEGRSSAQFVHYFKWEMIDNYVHDDSLLVKFSICIVNQTK